MRSRSPSLMSASSSEGEIEMGNLEDIVITPINPRCQDQRGTLYGTGEDSDDDLEGEEWNVALLGPGQSTNGRERTQHHFRQGWHQMKSLVIETVPTLLLTTIGLLFTGELLDRIANWKAMKMIDELIIIIPVILNLKGNLEMNLSARLGTAANIGELDDPKTLRRIALGNLSLLQVQATVVSFVAACVSFILALVLPKLALQPGSVPPSNSTSFVASANATMSRRPRPPLPINAARPPSGFVEFIMVASTSMSAACLSSIILGSFMCGLVIACRRFGRDPDNIAPPIAACLGDLVTLSLLGVVSAALINFVNTPVPFIIGLLVILFSMSCALFTWRNPFVKDLITQGWSPLFGAMVISCGTGIVLDLFANREGFPILAIIIGGLPGSVGSIFVSRLSTALHAAALLPSSNISESRRDNPNPKLVMTTLLLITIPLEVMFLAILHWFGWLRLSLLFAVFSVIFFCLAVITSLFLARFITNYLWFKRLDPDIYALPIHSALVDLIAQLLLVLCFEVVLRIRGTSNN